MLAIVLLPIAVGHYHPHWREYDQKENDEQETSMKWLPDLDISSDVGDDNLIHNPFNSSEATIPISNVMNNTLLEEIALSDSEVVASREEKVHLKTISGVLEEDNYSNRSPTKRSHRSASNASISSCQTEIKEWVQDEDIFRASSETRHSRMLSKDTILEGFAPPPDLVDDALKTFAKSIVNHTQSDNLIPENMQTHVPSNTVLPLVPIDYELKTLNVAFEQESSLSWTIHPSRSVSAADQSHSYENYQNHHVSSSDLDCKSLLSFGFCSSSHDDMEHPHSLEKRRDQTTVDIAVVPDAIGKKRSLQSTRCSSINNSCGSLQSDSGELVHKDARHSSCIIS